MIGIFCYVKSPILTAQNLMPNASFEVCQNYRHITGSARWGRFQMTDPRTLDDPSKRTWYIDDTTAWHSKKSVCIYSYLESQFINVEPGQTYTVSMYAKAGSLCKAKITFRSGKRKEYIIYDSPSIEKEIDIGEKWQRFSMTGQTVGELPCVYAMYIEVYGNSTPVWIDAVQIEKSEEATPFKVAKKVEVSAQIIDETPAIGIYFKEECPRLSTKVFVDNVSGGKIELIHRIINHKGVEVDKIKSVLTVDNEGYANEEIPISFKFFGAFRIETDVNYENTKENAASEAIFSFIPRIPKEFDNYEKSPFGSRIIMPPFPKTGAERFLPAGFSRTEKEELESVGANPPYNYATVTAEQALKLGIRWVRCDMSWEYIEKEPNKYDWSELDSRFSAYKRLGFQIQVLSASSPVWSHPSKTDTRCPPDNIEDWKRFLRKFATRYKGRFKAFEVWNESFSNFLGNSGEYSEILKAAYETLKEVDPEIAVLGVSGCEPSYQFAMTSQILEKTGTRYMNKFSYHHKLFDEMPDEMVYSWENELQRINQKMAKHGDVLKIWNTEGGCYSDTFYKNIVRGDTGALATKRLSAKEAVAGLVRSYIISIANGVERFQYFGTYNARSSCTGAWSTQELIDFPLADQWYEPGYSPKPAAVAHAVLASQIAGLHFVEKLNLPKNERVAAYIFDGGEGPLAILWALQSRSKNGTFSLTESPENLRIYDVMGNLQEKGDSTPFGAEPIYVKASSLKLLKTAILSSRVTGLPLIDKITMSPDIQAVVRSSGDSGFPELLLKIINTTSNNIEPKARIAFENNNLKSLSLVEMSKVIKVGQASELIYQLKDLTRPFSQQNTLAVEILNIPQPAFFRKSVDIAYALKQKKVIKIDGDLSDWESSGIIMLGEKKQTLTGSTNSHNGELLLGWDNDYFYLAVKAIDGYINRNPDLKRLWDGTSIEVFLDVDITHDVGVTAYNQDDYHFIFAPGIKNNEKDALFITNNSANDEIKGILMKSAINREGYNMEIAIHRDVFDYEPWIGGAGKVFKKGHSFGFGISLNKSNETEISRKGMLMWGGYSDNWRDPSKLATVIMIEE